jgi:hypothetical protein
MNEENVRSRGRPRVSAEQGKRYPIAIRTTKFLKERLERASKASGRSLAQELEFRLERSFEVQDITKAVSPLIDQIGKLVVVFDSFDETVTEVAKREYGMIKDLIAKKLDERELKAKVLIVDGPTRKSGAVQRPNLGTSLSETQGSVKGLSASASNTASTTVESVVDGELPHRSCDHHKIEISRRRHRHQNVWPGEGDES